MKSSRFQRRFYRDWGSPKDLHSLRLVVKETDLEIFTDKIVDKNWLLEKISKYRSQIEAYISKDERFLTSLKPIGVELRASPIVREMARVSKKANVGPMAAVAGAICQFLSKDLARLGCKEIIIENGGDIYIRSAKERLIGIYTGKSKFLPAATIRLKPKDGPLGIAASSGTIGHSLSFGLADSVVILARNASLADAAATATGNLVRTKKDLERAISFARSIRGVRAAIIVIKDNFISWGKVEFA